MQLAEEETLKLALLVLYALCRAQRAAHQRRRAATRLWRRRGDEAERRCEEANTAADGALSMGEVSSESRRAVSAWSDFDDEPCEFDLLDGELRRTPLPALIAMGVVERVPPPDAGRSHAAPAKDETTTMREAGRGDAEVCVRLKPLAEAIELAAQRWSAEGESGGTDDIGDALASAASAGDGGNARPRVPTGRRCVAATPHGV